MHIYITKSIKIVLLLFTILLSAQVGINTSNVHPSAILEIKSENSGLLLPRVSLTSTDDISTIANPAKGLIVFNLTNSDKTIPNDKKVYADLIYTYDGSKWNPAMSEITGVSSLNLPVIYARGRKTTVDTNCTGYTFSDFALNSREYNISQNGAITAYKSGFYKYNVSIIMYFNNNHGRNPVIGYSKGTNANSHSFTFRKENYIGYDNYNVSYSGVVYLNANENSGHFSWSLGGRNVCNNIDRIRQQEVIWEYLGNTL